MAREKLETCRQVFYSDPWSKTTLERELNRQLHLPRIAHALPQEPVKVKQSRRHERVDVVGVVEGIEHLDDRNDREALVEFDRPLNAPVKREVFVVFARGVAIRRRANAGVIG